MKHYPSQNFDKSKVIRPYLSSAFVDLQDEISYLHSNAFVKLNKFCQTYGGNFQVVDNRRTSIDFRATHDFALSHALDKVQECHPYFICVIGSHYGPYCSSSEMPIVYQNVDIAEFQACSAMKRNIISAASHGHDWVAKTPHALSSFLELEIQQAAFKHGSVSSRAHCYFYFHDCYKILLTERPVSSKNKGFGKSLSIQPVREVEDIEAQGKLDKLKDRILKEGYNLRFFNDSQCLDEVIYDDWKKVCDLELEKKIPGGLDEDPIYSHDGLMKEVNIQLQSNYHLSSDAKTSKLKISESLNSFAKGYIDEKSIEKNITVGDESFLNGNKLGDGIFCSTKTFILEASRHEWNHLKASTTDHRIFALVGETGIGKSSLIFNWTKEFKRLYPGIPVIYESCGFTNESLYDVLLRIVTKLRGFHWQKRSPNCEICDGLESFERISEMFAASLQLVPCIVVIDGLDEIKWDNVDDAKNVKALRWLPDIIPKSCRFIVSTCRSDGTCKSLTDRTDVTLHHLAAPDELTRHKLLNNLATVGARNYLDAISVSKIAKSRLGERPLVLSAYASVVSICRDQRNVEMIIDKLVAYRTTRDFWKGFFIMLSKRLSWSRQSSGQPGSLKNNPNIKGWLSDALKLILSSRDGLRREEILQMLNLLGYQGRSTVTPNDWELFMAACGRALLTNSRGYVMIPNRDVRESLGYWLLGTGVYSNRAEIRQLRYHAFIASYLIDFAGCQRKLDEMMWQLMKAQNWSKLCQIVSEPSYFVRICERARCDALFLREILFYWKVLEQKDFQLVHSIKQTVFHMHEFRVVDKTSPQHQRQEAGTGAAGTLVAGNNNRFDESASVIRDYQTEDSKSEVDFSDTDSSLHNYSEYNADSIEPFYVGGWTPMAEHAMYKDKLAGEEEEGQGAVLDADDMASIKYFAAWFLFRSGSKHLCQAKALLSECSKWLVKAAPLSPHQRHVQLLATELQCHLAVVRKPKLLQDMVDSCGAPLVSVLDLTWEQKRNIKLARGNLLLRIAELHLDTKSYPQARKVLQKCHDEFECCESVDGLARVYCLIGKFASKTGNDDRAKNLLDKAVQTLVEWHGVQHVKVAYCLTTLGDHFCRFINLDGANGRRALIAYKEALKIYEANGEVVTSTKILGVMGKLLHMEGSRNSKTEALHCFIRAKDNLYLNNRLQAIRETPALNKDYKKTAADLVAGRYEYGIKPHEADMRSVSRPYSELSYRDRELKNLLHSTSQIPRNLHLSASDEKAERPKPNPLMYRPYTAYSVLRIGKDVILSSKKSEMASKIISKGFLQICNSGIQEEKASEVAWQRATSAPATLTRNILSQPKSYNELHNQEFSGSPELHNRILREFHGPHSLLDVLKNPPPKSHSTVKASDIVHKSAWFNVPGRYTKAGESYAPKRNQKPKNWKPDSSPRTSMDIEVDNDESLRKKLSFDSA